VLSVIKLLIKPILNAAHPAVNYFTSPVLNKCLNKLKTPPYSTTKNLITAAVIVAALSPSKIIAYNY
jgi:hypothetical protein